MNRIREITLDLSKEIETVRLENEIEDNLKLNLKKNKKNICLERRLNLLKKN